MDDIKAKQQIVGKIKDASNILVTVSDSPSVDALSAALGLTLLFDKLEKHPTAIFSGAVPPAISFLEPEKTFDETTDSLRDFIIALDKTKADHLRYKIEGDSVKIFITPYKTTITSDDLEFSQGDINVELVIALGVDNQDHLDKALESHGQILHDATIITVTAGEQTSSLGGIDWHDDQASSLSEMITGLAEAMKTDKSKSLLDGQVATALLTGIVAATDRFSNPHTTSTTMNVASQLMTAGADQQLISTKLEEGGEATPSTPKEETLGDAAQDQETPAKDKSSLNISHVEGETLEEMDKRVKAAEQSEAAEAAEASADAYKPSEASKAKDDDTPKAASKMSNAYALDPDEAEEPSMGGTLNATSEQAAEDAKKAADDDRNKTILNHSYMGAPASSGVGPATAPSDGDGHSFLGDAPAAPGSSDVNAMPPQSSPELVHSAYAPPSEPDPTLEPPAPSAQPGPQDLGLPMPPPVPDFAQQGATDPNPAYAPPAPSSNQPERLGDILEQPQPTTPAVEPPAPTVPPAQPETPPATPPSNDPGQFKIPGQ